MGMWDQNQYVIKQKVLTIGRKYYIYDSRNALVGFCQQKLFKLKEDIRIYSDDSKRVELLNIKQQNILDFTGTFAITDSTQNALIGYVGRKAFTSIIRDTWKIFDHQNREIGTVQESSGVLAVMRRFISLLSFVPKKFEFLGTNGTAFAHATQKFKIIGDTWILDIYPSSKVDVRLVVTAALMMDIIEQSQGR